MSAADFAAAFESAVRYSRDHHDVNALAAALPFAATRASENGVLHPHRAALADALSEAGRDHEFQIAADPSKNLRMLHHPDGYWHFHEAPPRSDDRLQHVHNDARSYLETALWSSTGEDENGDETPLDDQHNTYDFTDEAVERAQHAVEKFKSKLSPLARDFVEYAPLHLGHDLWLTRNGHGSGFGDGDWEREERAHLSDILHDVHAPHLKAAAEAMRHDDPSLTKQLIDAAHSMGEQHVTVEPLPNGDATDADGYRLHLYGGRE